MKKAFPGTLATVLSAFAVLFCPSAPDAQGQQPKLANRVHFLIAADTMGGNANKLGIDLDRNQIKKVIADSMQSLKYAEGAKYKITVLDGVGMSEKTVLDHYRKLKVGANETLVFFYTGHGGFYPEKGHLLAMRNFYDEGGGNTMIKSATVDRKELLAAMGRHNPRAIIVLTDCCASSAVPVFSGARVAAPDKNFKNQLKAQGKGELARDLFFRTQGVVNITAAMTGTPARGDRNKGGSHFTVALEKLLREDSKLFDDNKDGVVEWSEFFPRLTTLTQLESLLILKDAKGQAFPSFHTPEAFALGEPVAKAKAKLPVGGKPPVLEKDETLTAMDQKYNKDKGAYFIKNYPVAMLKDRAYLVSLQSSQFDTFLFVKDANAKTLVTNDDYGNTTTRSRILFFPPATGVFQVGVSSYGAGETGDFSLMVQESVFADALAATDPKDRYCLDSFAKRHAIHLKAQRSYTVRLESEDTKKYDPFLRVIDEFGNTVALNDDEDEPQGRLNSLVSFRTVSAGTYYVIATSFGRGQTGRYGVFIQD